MYNKSLNISLSLLLGLGAFALSSCSETDQPVGGGSQQDERAIRFAANTEFSSRAADITTNSLTKFYVYAYTGTADAPVTFMDNVTVQKDNSNVWTYSPVKYWPAEDVSFYAYAPEGWVGSTGPLKPVSYDNSVAKTDLIYAVSPNLNGNVSQPNAQVVFNFRHALAKVTVLLSSTNTDLRVEVTNVALSHIMSKGDFTFPSASTQGTPTTESTGTWTNLTNAYPYMLHMSQTQDDVVVLTSTPTDLSESGLGGPAYMIPQLLSWRSAGAGNDTYMALMCSIYDAETGVKLWPNKNTPEENIMEGSTNGDGIMKFPLSTSEFSEWKPGYHYIYNLVVNGNSEMGSIEFGNPTVDTYVDVSTTYE